MKPTDISFALSRLILDGVSLLGAFILAYFWRMRWHEVTLWDTTVRFFPAPTTLMSLEVFLGWAVKIMIVILFIFVIRAEYRFTPEEKFSLEIKRLFWSLMAGLSIVLAYFFFAQWHFFSRLVFALGASLSLFFLLWGRLMLRQLRLQIYRHGWGRKKILIIGHGQIATQVITRLKSQPQCTIIGCLTEQKTTDTRYLEIPILGSITDFEACLNKQSIDEVWLASDHGTEKLTDRLVQLAHIHHKKFRFFPDELGMDLAAVSSSTFLGIPMLTLLSTKLDGWSLVIKTIFDLCLAIMALLVLWPVMVGITLLLKLKEPKAPVIYRSTRVGRKGVNFDCLKFRTMVPNADKQKSMLKHKNERGDILFKMQDDPRITPFGKFLRKYSLDELPQLINVLRLEMSFIGPRPHLVEEVAQYPEQDRQVLTIRPGMTGFAQINGRSTLTFAEEMRYEMYYLKNWSLWLDVVIFIKSIWVVVTGKDAS